MDLLITQFFIQCFVTSSFIGPNILLRTLFSNNYVPLLNMKGNDVSNQQDATTFSFINLFKSALNVSGDKFAHPQEHILSVYTAFCAMHRHCCIYTVKT